MYGGGEPPSSLVTDPTAGRASVAAGSSGILTGRVGVGGVDPKASRTGSDADSNRASPSLESDESIMFVFLSICERVYVRRLG